MHLILFLSPKRVHFSKTTDAWCTMYVFFLSDFAWCSLLLLWTTVVIITFVVKLSKETKQRTSKMTLSIWQEKIETKWLENSPQNKWSGLPGSLFNPEPLKGYLLPWTIRAIDRKCKTSSQLSQRSILLFWMDKRSFKNLFFKCRNRVVNSTHCKDVRESLELKGG